ncbi:coiled-coil domain-containing protein 175 [Notechis scutatus]|uniref:Coiled-coil domain-containing protein 175 n=1 Tax=Notechis scutatus TaxID=8663 RepID=A0A6J1UDV2_9SAUR|nr:coiled-coil domain-containing protein 175 [Notechis scutatus]
MAPPSHSSRCSESAAAALKHLQGVEKQLQNERLLFNKETVQHLEDAVKAIKKLEKERKDTIELLEEETIKNCNLRIRVKNFPAIVMKEFEELVAAAHRFHLNKLREVEASMNETIAAVEEVYTKQMLFEEQNETLCKEQDQTWEKYNEIVQLVNQQMAAKHSMNIKINELRNMTKKEEDETAMEEIAIEDLKQVMAAEALQFKEKKASLGRQIEELQKKLQMRKNEAEEKKKEFEELLKILCRLQKKVSYYNQVVTYLKKELEEILKTIKDLIQEYERKKAEKEELIKKRLCLQDSLVSLDTDFDEEKENLLQQLAEIDRKLQELQEVYQKVKEENDTLNMQYQILTSEEEHFCSERDKLAAEFEKLSNWLTEKLDYMAKRVIETKNTQEELDEMQDIYDSTHRNYARELAILEATMKKESDKREQLQIELDKITALYQDLLEANEKFLNESKQKLEAMKKSYNKLKKENERLSKEIKKHTEHLKHLTSKLQKKEINYKKQAADLTTEIKKIEEEYNSKTKRMEEMEEKLQENVPLAEELQKELEEISTNYTKQKDLYNELQDEESALKVGIEQSLREIKKLERQKVRRHNICFLYYVTFYLDMVVQQLKDVGFVSWRWSALQQFEPKALHGQTIAKAELSRSRDKAFEQLTSSTYSIKFIERDNYEIDRMLFILNGENARLRAGIAYLKEDISTIDEEAKTYQLKRQQIQQCKKVLYELFAEKWTKDEYLQKIFLKYQHELLIILEEYVRRNTKRNVKVDYVHEGLQLNYEEMDSLLRSKSLPEADKVSILGKCHMIKQTTRPYKLKLEY